MLERVHQSRIIDIMEKRENGHPAEFSIQFCKLSTGELVYYPRAVLSSYHATGSTINILPHGYSEPRKIRRCLITQINGIKVYL